MKDNKLEARILKRHPDGPEISATFEIPLGSGHVTIIFGPSGSGKTTLLRCLAGLDELTEGSITFGGELWADTLQGRFVRPQDRSVGFLHQQHALFGHLSVFENVGYALTSVGQKARSVIVSELLAVLRIEELADRMPGEISFGQQQRVALARALARRPKLMLLDEPFTGLDEPTRQKLRSELKGILERFGVAAILVTHDWVDALSLGDQLVALQDGQVRQIGPPAEVFSRPNDLGVAAAVGMETILEGRVVRSGEGLVTVAVGGHEILAVDPGFEDSSVFVCLRASDVTLESAVVAKTSARNHLAGAVTQMTHEGNLTRVVVNAGFEITAFVTRPALEDLRIEPGRPVIAAFKASAVHLIPRSG